MKCKCESCGKKIAEWCYMPRPSHYLCDDCITNSSYDGCSCNWHSDTDISPIGTENKDWKKVDEKYWQYIDSKGRPFPCVEYEYSEHGWDESIFDTLKKLDTKETYQDALDLMNRYFSNWLNAGHYDICGELIKTFTTKEYSLELNLNLLLLTNKLKASLDKASDGRKTLCKITREICVERMSPEKTESCISYLE